MGQAVPTPEWVEKLGQAGGPLLVVVGFLFLLLIARDYWLTKKIDNLTREVGSIAGKVAAAISTTLERERADNREQIDRLFAQYSGDIEAARRDSRELHGQLVRLIRETVGALNSFKEEVKADLQAIRIRLGWEAEVAASKKRGKLLPPGNRPGTVEPPTSRGDDG